MASRNAAIVGVLAIIGVALAHWFARPASIVSPPTSTIDRFGARHVDPPSPYENTRPGVSYVGDAACARCHTEIAQAYSSHPMGRSLAPATGSEAAPWARSSAGLPIEQKGVHYTIESRGHSTIHKSGRQDANGQSFATVEAEVKFALGSGTRGTTFLIDRDGWLFQSPISWFAQEQRWDISPGYGEFSTHADFDRAIQPDCLFCHSNRVRPVAGTVNRYAQPIFEEHAIGCERCHGPGQLHVNRTGPSPERDMTIVNPADLAPSLRDSVCQQCHLQGSVRFPRAVREAFDYRPGLPLHRFLAVFLLKNERERGFEAVGHDEQMQSSRCFAASNGRLGCISCHDPHRSPPPAGKAAYYRNRCLACHDTKGCSLSSAERVARGRGDDCISCHMPRPKIKNVPHTAATDHRILRKPTSQPARLRDTTGQPTESPLIDYHWPLLTDEERRDAARDIGVAQGWAARGLKSSPQVAKLAAIQALPLLESAVREHPDDLDAREFLGHALEILGRGEDAVRSFEEITRIEPNRELALRSAGRLLMSLHRPELARKKFESAIAINPWRAHYRLAHANACSQAREWQAALAACQDALRLNPEMIEARSLLIKCYLQSHQSEPADAEFQILLRFYPASREVWQKWYDDQKRTARGATSER